MARKGSFTKKSKVGPRCQQPQTAPPPASATHRDDSEIFSDSGDNVHPTSRPFLPPRSVPRPAPQTSTTTIQNSEPSRVNSTDNANVVDSVDQEVDDLFVDSIAQNRKGRKPTVFWEVRIIDSDGTIKPARLSIVLRFNKAKQAIGNEAGLLSSVLGLLGFDFGKFSICEKSWRKITTKDKFIMSQIFHIDEDSEGTIKKNILKSMGKSWKKTRLRLYNTYFEPTFTTKQNIENRPPGIDREHWRWFLDYRAKPKTKVIWYIIVFLNHLKIAFCLYWTNKKSARKMRRIDQNNYIPTLAGRKVLHGRSKKRYSTIFSEEQGRIVGRGELWITVHKKKDGSYMNDEARAIGVFRKEKPGRVRGVGFGPAPSQLFGPNSHGPGNGVQLEETQRKLLELQTALEGEKLKRKAMKDEAAADKKKMKGMESALIYLFQRQGEELPPDIASGMSFVEE
ncbi:hypothetical protein Ahy_A01g002603 [Arachis hypogaea]|uniref:Uncharacterized protein n=1 Tax=Arachis hypogaea TaxID=3818 RepID=A0A445EQZ5_ARAHY|nr:hypothetical protein Ahy_A01g002603 [Arachis hypogaea]